MRTTIKIGNSFKCLASDWWLWPNPADAAPFPFHRNSWALAPFDALPPDTSDYATIPAIDGN